MKSPQRVDASIVAVLAVVALIVSACQAPAAALRTPTATAAATATAAPDKTPVPTRTPPPVKCLVDPMVTSEPCLGRMSAGTYEASALAVPATFTVPNGWLNDVNILGAFRLQFGEERSSEINVWADPVVADQRSCQKAADESFGSTVREIVDFLAANPGLEVTKPKAITLGGLTGSTFDIAMRDGTFEPCSGKVTMFVHTGELEDGFWWYLEGTTKMHVVFLDAPGGHTVMLDVEARLDHFEAWVAQAQPIVDSFDFSP